MTKGDETAFPARGVIEGMAWATEGMTKREMFAAMAMQGILSDLNHVKDIDAGLMPLQQVAVAMADHLIDALNKLPNQVVVLEALTKAAK